MKVNLRPTTLKVSEDIPGLTEESTKGFGRITRCTVKEPLYGLMVENTRANT